MNYNIKKFTNHSELISDIHSAITPAEVRQGEKISAKIKWKNDILVKSEEVRVWRLSPLGIEVVEIESLQKLKVGDRVDMDILVGKTMSSVSAQKVIDNFSETGVPLVGLRFCSSNEGEWKGIERRINKRWNCSAEFMPNGVTPNPGRFNDFIFFRVSDISSTGFRFITSLRNIFLIPGMKLDTTVSFPLIGQTRIDVIIRNCSIQNENGKDVLAVGVEYIDKKRIPRDMIGQYVFQFGPAPLLNEIKKENLSVIRASRSIEFRYVRTDEEYRSVLELRKRSYQEAGKINAEASLDDVADIYDTRARIVIGMHQGRVVASARLIFNELDDQMEHEQFVNIPHDFPRKDEICEITRVCTHPDYRGSQILIDLFSFVGLSVVQSKRKYVLGCGTDEILNLYRSIGFTITNISYAHSSLNNIKHTIFIGNVVRSISGEGVSPIYWNLVWGDLYQYLEGMDYVERNPLVTLRVGFYRLFRPLSFFIYSLKQKKKNKKVPG